MTIVDLTATQLAERLGVTTRRVRDLLRSNEISGRQLANGTWLADSDAVARYEVSATQGSSRAAVSVLDTDLIEDVRQVASYVRSGTIDNYAINSFMIPTASGHDAIFENTLPVDYAGETMQGAVIAADLAMSTDTRERSAGLRALEEMRLQWLAAH